MQNFLLWAIGSGAALVAIAKHLEHMREAGRVTPQYLQRAVEEARRWAKDDVMSFGTSH